MAHIGHEIASAGLHSRLLGLIVEINDDEARMGVCQQPDVPAHRNARPCGCGTPRRGEINLHVLTGRQGVLGGRPDAVVEQSLAHQAQLGSPVVAGHDVSQSVHHDDTDRRQSHRTLQHLSHRHTGLRGRVASAAVGACGRRQPGGSHSKKETGNPGNADPEGRRTYAHAESVRIR